jgi:prophage tail gpP-like protein
MTPVVITIGGSALTTWTEMTLSRKKEDLTGELSVTIFAGAVPSTPMVQAAKCGAEVTVYVGGSLAFTGNVDARRGTGSKKGKQGTAKEETEHKGDVKSSVSIGPNEYTIKLTARGKCRDLIDSSHQHPTTNMMKPTTKEVVEKLIQPFGVQADWKGEVIKLDKQRFRDGARVIDELHRVALENCYFMYETRDGKLCVTDGCAGSGGDSLILGYNILTFSAEQSEDETKGEIKVKGQRSDKKIWGKKSLEKTHKKQKNSSTKRKTKLTVQHYGDATEKELERRARFEMNKRNSLAKKITIEVFHVQTPSGAPWDIGGTHYVEVPPEGIFDMFECTELTYHVNAEKELKTTLTLSPPPSGGDGGGGGGGGGMMGGGGFGLGALAQLGNIGAARRSQAGITLSEDSYPEPWTAPVLSAMPLMSLLEEEALAKSQPPKEEERKPPVPLTLPPWFGETS